MPEPKSDKKGPIDKLKKFVEEAVEGLQQLLNPPRPIRVRATAGGSRRPR